MDKLFAIKLVVLSMIVAVDKLLEYTEHIEEIRDTPFLTHLEDSSFFLPTAAYDQRIVDLCVLEEKKSISPHYEFSRRLKKSLEILRIIHGEKGLRSLLAVNIKEFINEALFFIIDIQLVVNNLER
jgi:hypothetical protein